MYITVKVGENVPPGGGRQLQQTVRTVFVFFTTQYTEVAFRARSTLPPPSCVMWQFDVGENGTGARIGRWSKTLWQHKRFPSLTLRYILSTKRLDTVRCRFLYSTNRKVSANEHNMHKQGTDSVTRCMPLTAPRYGMYRRRWFAVLRRNTKSPRGRSSKTCL